MATALAPLPRRIGIVGCGVAGLAAAVALARAGHRVTLIERAPTLGPVGAGLLLQPSGQIALHRLGLFEEVVARAEKIEGLHAWTHRRRTLIYLPYLRFDPTLSGYGVHRGDLFRVLYDHAGRAGVEFRLGVTVAGSRQTGGHVAALDEAGSAHGPFDVLLAADGSRSRLRDDPQLGARVRPFPLGAVWFSGKCDTVRHQLLQVTRGSRQLIGMLPVGDGRCSLFCALPAGGREDLERRGLDALKGEIASLCPEAEPLLGQIRSIGDLAFARYQLVCLRHWSHGRLACIGDAAHSTTPHLGQGVNLALLDAFAVAWELNRSTDDDPSAALARACDVRRKQVMWSWRLSNLLGPVFQNEGWLLAAARDRVLPWMPGLPWVGRLMAGTMAGVRTGLFSTLTVGE